MSVVMQEVPRDDPLRVAWEKYKASADYENNRKWALQDRHVDGSLWAAFMAGYLSAKIWAPLGEQTSVGPHLPDEDTS